jgi:hypothetical protein
MENIVFIEDPIWPTAIFTQLLGHYEKIGTVHRSAKSLQHPHGLITGYTPNAGEEDSFTMVLHDHMALTASEGGMDTKRTMDLQSKYYVILRNLFDLTIGAVQQFNSDLTTVNREKFKKVTEASIMPQRVDFGDSTYTYRDADVVWGLISPAKFDMKSFYGYDVSKLGSYLVMMCLLKNRYGTADVALPLFVDPVVGMFYDLPPSEVMDEFYLLTKQIETCLLNYRINR